MGARTCGERDISARDITVMQARTGLVLTIGRTFRLRTGIILTLSLPPFFMLCRPKAMGGGPDEGGFLSRTRHPGCRDSTTPPICSRWKNVTVLRIIPFLPRGCHLKIWTRDEVGVGLASPLASTRTRFPPRPPTPSLLLGRLARSRRRNLTHASVALSMASPVDNTSSGECGRRTSFAVVGRGIVKREGGTEKDPAF